MKNEEAIQIVKEIRAYLLGFKYKENIDKLNIIDNILASGCALPDEEAMWLLHYHGLIKQRYTDKQLDLIIDKIRNS